MKMEVINFVLAFFEGFVLILSPCILPILPIMLAGSIEGGKKRPIGIMCGFVITFALITFFARTIVQFFGIDLNLIREIAYALIILFGIVLVSDYLSSKFTQLTEKIANTGSNIESINKPQGGFFSGLLLGCFISIIWTPCVGPILAAAIVQTAIQKSTLVSLLTFFFFALGSVIPMVLIAVGGRKLISQFNFFKTHAIQFRKLLGIIIIVVTLVVAYIDIFSVNIGFISSSKVATASTEAQSEQIIEGLGDPYSAPDLANISAWINSPPLKLKNLKGKVVLIDFWAYSCINCIRTLPHLIEWDKKYRKQGLIIIGVHSPEFEFEKNLSNVKKAVIKYGIKYPVALDNDFSTWLNFHNQYWPAHYLIDKNGKVVYEHFGEGEYDVTENNIRILLGIKGPAVTQGQEIESTLLTPETYLGYERAQNFKSPESVVENQPSYYSFPEDLQNNEWALQGKWNIQGQKILSVGDQTAIKIHFYARKVFVVAGSSSNKSIAMKVFLNGKPMTTHAGSDVINGTLMVSNHTLYEVINFQTSENGILELSSTTPGVEMYTFTFGS